MFEDVERIASPSYRPLPRDVLFACPSDFGPNVFTDRSRLGDFDFCFHLTNHTWAKKWTRTFFEDVEAIVFVVDLSAYDTYDENGNNRLDNTFKSIHALCLDTSLAETPLLLILNNVDAFTRKLSTSPIASHSVFRDYKGPADFGNAIVYFLEKFKIAMALKTYSTSPVNMRDTFVYLAYSGKETTGIKRFILNSTLTCNMTRHLRQSGFLLGPDTPGGRNTSTFCAAAQGSQHPPPRSPSTRQPRTLRKSDQSKISKCKKDRQKPGYPWFLLSKTQWILVQWRKRLAAIRSPKHI